MVNQTMTNLRWAPDDEGPHRVRTALDYFAGNKSDHKVLSSLILLSVPASRRVMFCRWRQKSNTVMNAVITNGQSPGSNHETTKGASAAVVRAASDEYRDMTATVSQTAISIRVRTPLDSKKYSTGGGYPLAPP